jgi:DNA-binding winged helix-turn-helix (wHTH) protein/Flp pilus assembly protein TadD
MSARASSFEFGPFRLDAQRRLLWRSGELVDVPPKAVDLLAVLVAEAGEVVLKRDLLQRAWPDTFVEEANLSVNVSALRRALGKREDGGSYIETVARRGYRFVAPARPSSAPPSLAVLPFRVLGAVAGLDWLGPAMADALITRLGGTGRVIVRPTSAVLRHGGLDPLGAARALGVDVVLEGSVQVQEGRLRVTMQLWPVSQAAPSWTDTLEAALGDIFAIEDEVAQRVAGALALTLSAGERVSLRRRGTVSLEAYEAYTRGRLFWSRLTGASLVKAFTCFAEAAALDPAYAHPHAGLADAHLTLGVSGLVRPHEAWAEAGAEARRAVELDDSVAEAHVSLAFVRLFESWDWAGAGTELDRATALGPGAAGPHQWRAVYLGALGRFDEAAREIERAREIDPVSAMVNAVAGLHHTLSRQADRALEQHRKTVELEPNQFLGYWGLGIALAAAGRHEEALAEHRRAVDLAEGAGFVKAVLARTLAAAGRTDEARSLLREEAATPASAYQAATVELALGEEAAALASLEQAVDAREPWVILLKVDPMLDPLRGHLRLASLEQRVFATAS